MVGVYFFIVVFVFRKERSSIHLLVCLCFFCISANGGRVACKPNNHKDSPSSSCDVEITRDAMAKKRFLRKNPRALALTSFRHFFFFFKKKNP